MAIIDAVCARGLQESVIIQSFRLPEIGLIAAAGISPMYLMGTADQATPAAIVAAGATFVGVNKDASNLPDVVAGLRAVGLRVLAWTVDMQNDYDAVFAAGCDGIFTNEPLYAARDYGYRTTTAPWPIDGTYSHGMLVYPGVGPLVAYPTMRGAGARSSAHPARGGGHWTSRPIWPVRCARSPTPPAPTRSPCGWRTTSRRHRT